MLSKRQKEILQHAHSRKRRLETWMHTSTIASLIRRGYIKIHINKASISIIATPFGRWAFETVEQDWKTVLHDTAVQRHKVNGS